MIKKISFIALLCFMWFGLSAQSIQNRGSDAVTVQDARISARYNLFLPKFLDTTAANLFKGIDSCAALIFTYDSNKVWYRQCNPKKWVIMGNSTGGGGSSTSGGIGSYQDSVANVLNYGADPTGVAGSAWAFRAAVATGRTVFVPKGVYKFNDSTVTLNNYQKMFGVGRESILLTTYSGSSASSCIIRTGKYNHVSDLALVGTGKVTYPVSTLTAQNGILVAGNWNNIFNIYAAGLGGSVIQMYDPTSFDSCWFNDIHNIQWIGCTAGIQSLINAQYNIFSNLQSQNTNRAFYNGNGNNKWNQITSESDNEGYIEGGSGGNNNHGTVSNFSFNHTSYPLTAANGIDVDMVYSNGNIFGGIITLTNVDNAWFNSVALSGVTINVSASGGTKTTHFVACPHISGLMTPPIWNVSGTAAIDTVLINGGVGLSVGGGNPYINQPITGGASYPVMFLKNGRLQQDSSFFMYDSSGHQLALGGSPSGTYKFTLISPSYELLRMQSTGTALVTLDMVNNAYDQGGIAYYQNEMLTRNKLGYSMSTTFNEIYPYDSDTAMNIGKSAQRWKNIYAMRSYLSGGVPLQAPNTISVEIDTSANKPVIIDAAGNFKKSFWPTYGGGTNIYNSDGSLTGNRAVNGANYEFALFNTSLFDISAVAAPTVAGVSSTGVYADIHGTRSGVSSYVKAFSDSVSIEPADGNLFMTNLTLGYGNKLLRWNSSTNKVTYVDTVADFSLTNGSHFLPDSLLIPISANALKVRSLQAGTNVTLTATDSSIIINASGGGGAGMAIGGTITSATAGSILYAGTNGFLQQSNSYLYYDSTNRRFYVGTNSGTGTLNLRAASGNTDFKLTDGSGTETWGAAATTAGDFAFFHSGATPFKIARFATDNALYINASGKTGFNTASPDSTVTINGGLRINNGAAVSGYVWTATGTDGRGTWQAATGGGLSSSNFVFNEVPSGTINGVNTTFTLANTPTAGTVAIFLRGLRMKLTTDYTISGSTITMINIPDTGDDLVVDYLK